MQTYAPRGTPASDSLIRAVRLIVDAVGEVAAARRLEVDRITVARVLAALPLQRRTHDHLQRMVATTSTAAAPPEQLQLPLAQPAPMGA